MEKIIGKTPTAKTIDRKDSVPGIKPPAESQLIRGGPINPDLERQYLETRRRLMGELGIHPAEELSRTS